MNIKNESFKKFGILKNLNSKQIKKYVMGITYFFV